MIGTPAATCKRNCSACQSDAGTHRGKKNGWPLSVCRHCGTLFVSCIPEPGSGEDYDEYYNPNSLAPPAFLSRRLDAIVRTFDPYRKHNRLLDVGFGAGMLLQAAGRAGWDAEGTEVSGPAIEHARCLGLKVFPGDLGATRYPAHSFDVVTASEVLEHVPDPLTLVQEVARVLRPGGLFWATTPHFMGLSGRLLGLRWSVVSPPEHLHLLTRSGVVSLFRSAGFERVRVSTQGVNPFELLHALRSAGRLCEGAQAFDRGQTGYRLNAYLEENAFRKSAKCAVNAILRACVLGDSLQVRAEA